MKTHWIKALGFAAMAAALSGCVVVPARPVAVVPAPVYAAPAPVYVAPAPVYVGPRVWFRGRWVYRQ